MKADCAGRLGVCSQHLGKKQKAERCEREYLHLLSAGIEGSYALRDIQQRLRELRGRGPNGAADSAIRKAIKATIQPPAQRGEQDDDMRRPKSIGRAGWRPA